MGQPARKLTARMSPPVARHQRQGMYLLPRFIATHRHARPALVSRVRHPYQRQFAGPIQRRQGRGVTVVGLDRLLRKQGPAPPPAWSGPGSRIIALWVNQRDIYSDGLHVLRSRF